MRDLLTHTSGLMSGGLGNRVGAAWRRATPGRHARRLRRRSSRPCRSTSSPARSGPTARSAGIGHARPRSWRSRPGRPTIEFLQAAGLRTARHEGHVVLRRPTIASRGSLTLYDRTPNGTAERQDTPAWLATSTFFSGGGGLWSTAEDYAQFAQMLVNGGELNGKRLLSPRTVDLMWLEPRRRSLRRRRRRTRAAAWGSGCRWKWCSIRSRRIGAPPPAASAGTARSARISGSIRKEQLIGVLMVQTPGTGIDARFRERRDAGDRRLMPR